jgi:hypothetical protein
MHMQLAVRIGYGSRVPWIDRQEDDTLRIIAGADQVVLRSAAPVSVADNGIESDFVVAAGETVAFTLTYAPSHLAPPDPIDPAAAFATTKLFWEDWAAKASVAPGERHHAIMRSLITLKALTYAPTGGIVAAPTTSLPETLGGIRNWDYRFCWLRDATLSLLALMNGGYTRRRRRGATGCCAPSPACRRRRRSCTASPARTGSPNGRSAGCRATRARVRCASAMARTASSSSTSTARSWTRSTRRAAAASPAARTPGT